MGITLFMLSYASPMSWRGAVKVKRGKRNWIVEHDDWNHTVTRWSFPDWQTAYREARRYRRSGLINAESLIGMTRHQSIPF